MGDALCGPSNALQNFQKHASADRTLQQDRIASHSRHAQGFRSHNPNQGALDQEFETFESAFPGAPLPDAQHHHPPPFFAPGVQPPAQAPVHPPPPQPEHAGWASDFQQLHISEPPQQAPQNHLQKPGRHPVGASDWQNEFNRQAQQSSQPPSTFDGSQRYGPTMSGMEFAGPGPIPVSHEASHAPPASSSAAASTFDESAFETAFAEAQAEVALQEDKEEQQEEPEAHTLPSESVRIGSDQIPAQREDGTTDGDELAKTAGDLLDRVSHDQSKKFQESNFLALMRQLRDREVTIQDNEFRQTRQPLHPGGQFYPEQTMLFSKSEAKGSGVRFDSSSDNDPQDPMSSGLKAPRKGYHAFASGGEESKHNSKGSSDRSIGDDNTLYEGYSLDELLVDRRTAHPLNCVFREDLEVPIL